MPLRVVQISDTHLSHRRAYAVPNVRAVLAWLSADPPDLVVHTGDITADDPDDGDEADFAHDFITGAGMEIAAIPGNHDVGGFSDVLFSADRLASFRRRWGDDTWSRDLGGWRLIGANVYRLLDDEHDTWLERALATDRPTALFLHQPICLVDPDVADRGDWSVPMPRRRRLMDLLAGRPVRVVASGHLHRYRSGGLPGGASTVWAPAASFIGTERPDGSTYRIGAVEHVLGEDGEASHRLVEPDGVTQLRLEDLVPPGSESLGDADLLPLAAVS